MREIEALRADLADALEALEPFKDACEDLDDDLRDGQDIWEHQAAMSITVGDLLRARAVYDRLLWRKSWWR